ncbi:nose resistant to fluoxetine protein 6-like [Stegodyphus dumicola]|uniref:nose resistant to fluoxetine protein 6-like n=1 Tax=Stegodyphus dumicola TaxID=202533 RepID=UPI0015A762A8|nr:nose resistant to fluoxetine protein 6-like [Stegodyphus dumicola]
MKICLLLIFVFILKVSSAFSESEYQGNDFLINKIEKDSFSNYDLLRTFGDISERVEKSVKLKSEVGHTFNSFDIGESSLPYDDAIYFQLQNYSFFKNSSSKCHQDLMYTLQNVGNLQNSWASQMIDSSGKPESGILQGNLRWYGDYNECINVYAPPQVNTSAGNFHGKYCTLQWSAQLSNFSLAVTSGVCIPDTCSSSILKDDFKEILEVIKVIPVLNKFDKVLNITDLKCNPSSKKLNSSAIAVICLISFFSLLAVLGSSITAYEYFCPKNVLSRKCAYEGGDQEEVSEKSNISINTIESNNTHSDQYILYHDEEKSIFHRILEKCKPFLKCFCVFSNGSKLLNTSGTEGQLLCIHGIRFLSMTWVILGHTYAFCFASIKSPLEIMDFIRNWPFQIVLQGFYSVDSFFVLSGFLLTYLFLQELSKREGKMSWIYFYVHRYVRLTPVYMITLAFSATVYYYLGCGPFWPETEIDPNCKNYWWWNLLYINNFQKSADQCMAWSWYLANDMQFFVISPLFLYSLWRWPKIGYSLLALSLCVTGLANFFITYHYKLITGLNSVLSADLTNALQFMAKFSDYFEKLYIKPYTRIGPYLVGMFLGYLLFKSKKSNRGKDNWIFLCCGWIVASAITLASVYGLYKSNPSLLATSFYNAFNRICFAGGLAWVIYVCLTKQAAVVDGILSYKFFIPLSRLTYCAYLIHPMILTGYFSSLRSLLVFSHATMTLYYLGFLVVTYGLALPVSLIFESPIICLEKLIRSKFPKTETRL